MDSEGKLTIKLYNKRDYNNFLNVNFPFINSNSPPAPAYGVNIFQLIQYSRVCVSYQEFIDNGCCKPV